MRSRNRRSHLRRTPIIPPVGGFASARLRRRSRRVRADGGRDALREETGTLRTGSGRARLPRSGDRRQDTIERGVEARPAPPCGRRSSASSPPPASSTPTRALSRPRSRACRRSRAATTLGHDLAAGSRGRRDVHAEKLIAPDWRRSGGGRQQQRRRHCCSRGARRWTRSDHSRGERWSAAASAGPTSCASRARCCARGRPTDARRTRRRPTARRASCASTRPTSGDRLHFERPALEELTAPAALSIPVAEDSGRVGSVAPRRSSGRPDRAAHLMSCARPSWLTDRGRRRRRLLQRRQATRRPAGIIAGAARRRSDPHTSLMRALRRQADLRRSHASKRTRRPPRDAVPVQRMLRMTARGDPPRRRAGGGAERVRLDRARDRRRLHRRWRQRAWRGDPNTPRPALARGDER